VIKREDLLSDPRFGTNADRITNRAALHEVLFPVFRLRTAQEWVTLLEEAGIPTSLVEDLAEVTRQEQLAARNLLLPTGIDDVSMIGIGLKMGGTPGSVRRPPPELGADTKEVLAELGLPASTVSAPANGASANTADQQRQPPDAYAAPQAPSRAQPGEGAIEDGGGTPFSLGEGLPQDLGGHRGDHSPGGKEW
jgi:hypothetical protein